MAPAPLHPDIQGALARAGLLHPHIHFSIPATSLSGAFPGGSLEFGLHGPGQLSAALSPWAGFPPQPALAAQPEILPDFQAAPAIPPSFLSGPAVLAGSPHLLSGLAIHAPIGFSTNFPFGHASASLAGISPHSQGFAPSLSASFGVTGLPHGFTPTFTAHLAPFPALTGMLAR